jgi:hypothetical protein
MVVVVVVVVLVVVVRKYSTYSQRPIQTFC